MSNPLFSSGARAVESFFAQTFVRVLSAVYTSTRVLPKTQPVPPLNAWQETVLQEMKQ